MENAFLKNPEIKTSSEMHQFATIPQQLGVPNWQIYSIKKPNFFNGKVASLIVV